MDILEREMSDILTGASFNIKIAKFYGYSPLSKICDLNELCCEKEPWPINLFLTPPASPEGGQSYQDALALDQPSFDIATLSEVSSTSDLKSMLIRDCMWNGETPKKGKSFEKLQSLTKTPPLMDCGLRITYVDPSEIWPFHLNVNVKAGKWDALDNTNDNNDEEVEVDVVSVEVGHKDDDDSKIEEKALEKNVEILNFDNSTATASPLENSSCGMDHDYSCKLRSGVKRRRSISSDLDNVGNQKTHLLSGDESDPECEMIGRATHNVLERKRRNELKLRFQYLRDSIPEICGNDRAPKVSILLKAYNYILQLQEEEKELLKEMRLQKKRNEQLIKKVLEMRK